MAWIWLNESEYPKVQGNFPTVNGVEWDFDCEEEQWRYAVADFNKEYNFNKEIEKAELTVSADDFFHLFCDGELVGIGPVSSGGDFLCRGTAPKHYKNRYTVALHKNSFELFAQVRLIPEVLTDYSRGHGGFFVEGTVFFADGTKETFETDETWLCRKNECFPIFQQYDGAKENNSFSFAQKTNDIWCAEEAPIPMLSLNEIVLDEGKITLKENEEKEVTLEFDKIYGVYPRVNVDGACEVLLATSELSGQEVREEKLVFAKADSYMSFRMHSAGLCKVKVKNTDKKPVNIKVYFTAPWYPISQEGSFVTSNEDYNKIYDVCKHTLKICRQTLHLDSTTHQELLACTGDYYIETLMNLFCFGDMRLSEFDLMRTSDMLVQNNGKIFHTTYSMIWVLMLRDVYKFTGRKETLTYCLGGLAKLLDSFDTYIGDTGVIENPPDYMFVDWTVMDGYSMHHPPKYLGQTVLNAYYYGALNGAEEIYRIVGDESKAEEMKAKAVCLKESFQKDFWDEERKLYTDGKGDLSIGGKYYCPDNIEGKHFSKYPNILAALFGLADEETSKDILERIVFDENLQDIQPYFMHWMLCALRKYGLFEKYGWQIADRWSVVVKECDKGLKEGWIAPQPDYSFDHSHAWGGTVAYQMPMAITGLEILEAGMKKIRFTPNLYHLDFVEINIPTEYGMIHFKAEKGKEPVIEVPQEIEIVK